MFSRLSLLLFAMSSFVAGDLVDVAPELVEIHKNLGCQSFGDDCSNRVCFRSMGCSQWNTGELIASGCSCKVEQPCHDGNGQTNTDISQQIMSQSPQNCEQFNTACSSQSCYVRTECWYSGDGSVYEPSSKCYVDSSCATEPVTISPATTSTTSTTVVPPETTLAPLLPGDDEEEAFRQSMLEKHNYFRGLHQNTPPMQNDATIAQQAQYWANRLASENSMYHSSGTGYGENLYWTSSSQADGIDAVKSWYDEINLYDYNNPGFASGTGHFTQVVWVTSTKLGCARARSSGGTYVVCNYSPPGNYMSQFEQNVLPLK